MPNEAASVALVNPDSLHGMNAVDFAMSYVGAQVGSVPAYTQPTVESNCKVTAATSWARVEALGCCMMLRGEGVVCAVTHRRVPGKLDVAVHAWIVTPRCRASPGAPTQLAAARLLRSRAPASPVTLRGRRHPLGHAMHPLPINGMEPSLPREPVLVLYSTLVQLYSIYRSIDYSTYNLKPEK